MYSILYRHFMLCHEVLNINIVLFYNYIAFLITFNLVIHTGGKPPNNL